MTLIIRMHVKLLVSSYQARRHCLSQIDVTGRKLCDYDYKDIEYFCKVSVQPSLYCTCEHTCKLCTSYCILNNYYSGVATIDCL